MSVRIKLTIFGLLTIVLSVAIGYLIVTPLVANAEEAQYADEVKGQFELYANNVEHFRDDMIYSIAILRQSDEIYTDSTDFTNYLNAFDDGFDFSPNAEEQEIMLAMYDLALVNPNVDSIYIGYDATGAFVRTGPIQEDHPAGEGFNYDPRTRSWYTNATADPGAFVFNDIDKHPTEDQYFSTLSTTLYDIDNEFVGVLGIDIMLENYLDNFEQVENLSRGQFVYVQADKAVMINDDGSLDISELDEVFGGLDFVNDIDGFDTIDKNLEGTNYLVVVYQVEGTSIRFVHLITDAAIRGIVFSKIVAIRTLFIVVTLTLILAMLLVVNFTVLKPLAGIEEDIKDYKKTNIQGYFRFLEEGSKEFVQIAGVLNEMVDAINANMALTTERLKELDCLYTVTDLSYKESKLDAILQGTTHAIVDAMKYPDEAAVRIRYKEHVFVSQEFEPTSWMLSVELKTDDEPVGAIEVYYLSEQPDEAFGPFEMEEKNLLESVANALQIAMKYRPMK